MNLLEWPPDNPVLSTFIYLQGCFTINPESFAPAAFPCFLIMEYGFSPMTYAMTLSQINNTPHS